MKRNSTITIVRFVFSIVAVVSIQISNAQIVYTDVNPDITTSGTYNLDLNKDGTIDFAIKHTSKSVSGSGKCKGQTETNQYINVTPLNNNQVADTGTNVRKLSPNVTVDAYAKSWSSNSGQTMLSYELKCTYVCFYGGCGYLLYPTIKGQWYWANEDGFLGLKLIYGGHSYFGWLRISISEQAGGFIIKDYAFNSKPDQAILTGQSSDKYLGILPISNLNNYFCAGNNVTVPYVISGTFSTTNIVRAELSDATGSFARPVAIGSVVSSVSGSIIAKIPGLTPSGNGYRIRVTSSNPIRTSNSTPFNTYVQGGLPDSAIVTYDPTNLCQNGSVSIVATYDYPYGNQCYSYQWRLNGNNIPGATSDSYNAKVAGKYTCIKSNGAGSVTSNVITITANPLPAIIEAVPGPVVCGEYISLNNTGISGSYQWKLNGNNIAGATASSYAPVVSGNYSCKVTNTCGSFTSNTISVSINPPMADAVITPPGPIATCGNTFVLNANSGQGLSYQWYNVGYPYSTYNPQIISGAKNSSYAASVTGVYYVKETNSIGCSRLSDYTTTLIGNPEPLIYPSAGTVCPGNSVNIHAEPSIYISPANAYSYQWIKDGVNISNATSQNYAATQPGIYSVRVTLNSGGCSGTSASEQITSCSNNNTVASTNSSQKETPSLSEGLQALSVVPNPVSASTTISFSLPESEKISARIYDMNGRLIKTLVIGKMDKGIHQLAWNTENATAGIYMLRLQTSSSMQTKKIIVEK